MRIIWFVGAAMILVVSGGIAIAEAPVDPAAVKSEDGKYFDKEGNPTYKVAADGTVDWYTYSGLPPLSLGMPRLPWPRRRWARPTPRP